MPLCVILGHGQTTRRPKDAARDLARDLADLAGQLASLDGETYAYLSEPNYDALMLRLEAAHSALDAAAVEAPGGGYG